MLILYKTIFYPVYTGDDQNVCGGFSNNTRIPQSTPFPSHREPALADELQPQHPATRIKEDEGEEESEELNARQTTDARPSSRTTGCGRTPAPEGHRATFPSRDLCLCVSVVFTTLHAALSELPYR